jgi:hypothetical protein
VGTPTAGEHVCPRWPLLGNYSSGPKLFIGAFGIEELVVLSGISRELFEKGLSPPQNKCRVHKKEKEH